MPDSVIQAQAILRDASQFSWYVIPLLLVVIYVYANEVRNENWSVFLGGLAFWFMDWINEIWNSLLFHFSGFAPAWSAPADTAYLILIGLNIEICYMFAIMGVATLLMLPKDRSLKILGINNRIFIAVSNSILAVLVEVWLNHIGALVWEWKYWRTDFPFLIFLIGYLPFFAVSIWVHDMQDRHRQIKVVGSLAAVVVGSIGIFGVGLGWI